VAALFEKSKEQVNKYVDRIRQAAEEVSALVDMSKEQVNEYVDRTRQAAEKVSAIVDKSNQQAASLVEKSKEPVNEQADRKREAIDRGRAQWEEFIAQSNYFVGEQTPQVSPAVYAGHLSANGKPQSRPY
jgi:F0F1-type ATP synthase membrane subunit b/b'